MNVFPYFFCILFINKDYELQKPSKLPKSQGYINLLYNVSF